MPEIKQMPLEMHLFIKEILTGIPTDGSPTESLKMPPSLSSLSLNFTRRAMFVRIRFSNEGEYVQTIRLSANFTNKPEDIWSAHRVTTELGNTFAYVRELFEQLLAILPAE